MPLSDTFVIRHDHPSLSGHFPDNPIVPGAVILDEALAVIGAHGENRISAILRAKFTAPLPVDTPCHVEVSPRDDGKLAISCLAEGVQILSAIVMCGPPAPDR